MRYLGRRNNSWLLRGGPGEVVKRFFRGNIDPSWIERVQPAFGLRWIDHKVLDFQHLGHWVTDSENGIGARGAATFAFGIQIRNVPGRECVNPRIEIHKKRS